MYIIVPARTFLATYLGNEIPLFCYITRSFSY